MTEQELIFARKNYEGRVNHGKYKRKALKAEKNKRLIGKIRKELRCRSQ